ncbi:MAG TPA: cytochrome c oxidase assembly protein, partial [Conexibacter sp.]|nr:cytochrome c oxidase assembly protein [Conexibacter sp.]
HLLLLAVAPPLLLAGAPLALALRALPAGPRHALARVLAGRAGRAVTHPVLALVLFSAVVAGTHVPAFYDAALRHPPLHALEHALYLSTALLLWLPVVAVVPRAHPLSPLTRMLLVLAAMPAMIAVGVWLSSAARIVYPPYAHPDAAYGTAPLADQRLAGMLMWIGGSAAGGALALWLGWRAAAREEERQLARERAQDAAAAARPARAPLGGGAA